MTRIRLVTHETSTLGARLRNEGPPPLPLPLSRDPGQKPCGESHRSSGPSGTTGQDYWGTKLGCRQRDLVSAKQLLPAPVGRSSPWWRGWFRVWTSSSGGGVALGPQPHQILGPRETDHLLLLTEERGFFLKFISNVSNSGVKQILFPSFRVLFRV